MKNIYKYSKFAIMILFLDIDGVLNLQHKFNGRDEFGVLYEPKCIEAFKYLCENLKFDIVISSTRKMDGLKFLQDLWKKRNYPGNVIDITPDQVDMSNIEYYDLFDRGMEINQWMIDNNYKGKYLIIDDIPDFSEEQNKYFYKTNRVTGLTFSDVDKILSMDFIK
jgi:hypothetical protein